MKFKFPKVKSVTIKASIITGVFLVISQVIAYYANRSDSNIEENSSDNTVEVSDNKDSFTPIIIGENTDHKIEDLVFFNGDDVDLVQLKIDETLSDFRIEILTDGIYVEPGEKTFDKFIKNQDMYDSLYDILDAKYEKVYLDGERDIDEEIYSKLPTWEGMSPVLDLTLFNKGDKNLIISNLEIEIIGAKETGGDGGMDAYVKNAHEIESQSLYNLQLPAVHTVFDYENFYYEDSVQHKNDILKLANYKKKYRSELSKNVSDIQFESLKDQMIFERIYEGFAHLEPFKFELDPPLNFPSKTPIRFKLRVIDAPDPYYCHFIILRLKFYGSDSTIELPLSLTML